ncbi:hypothetical protein [Agromyces archimandritae]|uniref:Secreted protein n=1 Tax=Agromyces archimandritae TaxID=2781962 RepID=A0A975IME3_9MICO|nr:hypothetical protein [Agromyces archimandritae]QTX03383.1 hypothetical protein G127AT_08315 [Agromyces archimandritae]
MERTRTKRTLGALAAGALSVGLVLGAAMPAQAAVNREVKRYTTQAQCAAVFAVKYTNLLMKGYQTKVYHSCKYKVDNASRPWMWEISYW